MRNKKTKAKHNEHQWEQTCDHKWKVKVKSRSWLTLTDLDLTLTAWKSMDYSADWLGQGEVKVKSRFSQVLDWTLTCTVFFFLCSLFVSCCCSCCSPLLYNRQCTRHCVFNFGSAFGFFHHRVRQQAKVKSRFESSTWLEPWLDLDPTLLPKFASGFRNVFEDIASDTKLVRKEPGLQLTNTCNVMLPALFLRDRIMLARFV